MLPFTSSLGRHFHSLAICPSTRNSLGCARRKLREIGVLTHDLATTPFQCEFEIRYGDLDDRPQVFRHTRSGEDEMYQRRRPRGATRGPALPSAQCARRNSRRWRSSRFRGPPSGQSARHKTVAISAFPKSGRPSARRTPAILQEVKPPNLQSAARRAGLLRLEAPGLRRNHGAWQSVTRDPEGFAIGP